MKTIHLQLSKRYRRKIYVSYDTKYPMLCADFLHEMFDFPENAQDIYLKLSKKKIKESYKIETISCEDCAFRIEDTNYKHISSFMHFYYEIERTFKYGCYCQLSY